MVRVAPPAIELTIGDEILAERGRLTVKVPDAILEPTTTSISYVPAATLLNEASN